MSDTAASAAPTSARHYACWTLQVLLALAFLAAAAFKLSGAAPMVQIFEQIGVGQWFRIVTALVEVVGAVGLLVPGFAGPAGVWLAAEMACAVLVHLTILHSNPVPAIVLAVLCASVAYLRRQQIAALSTPRR